MKTTLKQCKPGDVVRLGIGTALLTVTAEKVPAANLIRITIQSGEGFWLDANVTVYKE